MRGRLGVMFDLFFHHEHPLGDLSNIVEESGDISLLFFAVAHLPGQTFSEQRRKIAVPPEIRSLLPWQTVSRIIHYGAGQRQTAEPFCPEQDRCLFDAEHAAAQTKHRGVTEPENLSAQAG